MRKTGRGHDHRGRPAALRLRIAGARLSFRRRLLAVAAMGWGEPRSAAAQPDHDAHLAAAQQFLRVRRP